MQSMLQTITSELKQTFCYTVITKQVINYKIYCLLICRLRLKIVVRKALFEMQTKSVNWMDVVISDNYDERINQMNDKHIRHV